VRGLAITAANFAFEVEIRDLGAKTLIAIDGGGILLAGVTGNGLNAIDQSDFLLL